MNNQIKKAFALVVVALSLSACQSKESSSPISARGGALRTATSTVNSVAHSGLQLNGIVYGSDQEGFQEAVVGFMSASVPEDYIGGVSYRGQQNTGFYIGGYVPLASGSLRTVTSGQVIRVSSNAKLLVAVYDYFPNQGNLGPLPPVVFTSAEGEISGNYAYLRFWDQYGMVEMEGQFDQNTFRGEFRYDNQVHAEGLTPHAGTIGTFEVPTCQFFLCN